MTACTGQSTTWHFYPRPPRGGRPTRAGSCSCGREFLSTPSARRATYGGLTQCQDSINFYPHPPRGGRLCRLDLTPLLYHISIHTLREEGDVAQITPPTRGWTFLSTPSARRATGHRHRRGIPHAHFYPHPPRGGRPNKIGMLRLKFDISIHTLREEGDGRR